MNANYLRFRPLFPINGWGNGELRERSYLVGSTLAAVVIAASYFIDAKWQMGLCTAPGIAAGAALSRFADNNDPHTVPQLKRLQLEWKTSKAHTIGAAAQGFFAMVFCIMAGFAVMAIVATPTFLKGTRLDEWSKTASVGFIVAAFVIVMIADGGSLIRGWLRGLLIEGQWEVSDTSREPIPGPVRLGPEETAVVVKDNLR